uniref:Uncharacterized protein n=1 Tax=Tetranychus urticae TaxID=32264 RepID=T1KNH5_TETUR
MVKPISWLINLPAHFDFQSLDKISLAITLPSYCLELTLAQQWFLSDVLFCDYLITFVYLLISSTKSQPVKRGDNQLAAVDDNDVITVIKAFE